MSDQTLRWSRRRFMGGLAAAGATLGFPSRALGVEASKRNAGRPTTEPEAATARATGSFEVRLTPQSLHQAYDDRMLGRMSIDKVFHGDLDATSTGEMLTARTGVDDSAGYVAIERVTGRLHGRTGTFVLQHSSTMDRGTPAQSIAVVPDSGTGGLDGLAGSMTIEIDDGGGHRYVFEYSIAGISDRAGFTFDLHAHPGAFFFHGTPAYAGDDGVVSRVGDMLSGGMTSGFFALVADMAILEITASGVRPTRRFEPGEAWADYERQMRAFRDLLPLLDAEIVTDLAGADAARSRGHVAAFVAVEGGDCLEGRPDRVGRLYDDGVRSLQLVHYAQNELGDLQTEPAVYDGLSPVGRDVVRLMAGSGMVIDVAHASFETARDAAEVSGAPIILSHSQLRDPDNPHPRHIDEDHARLIADTGGVIGMWPSGFGNTSLDDFVDNTLRMIDVVGVDHVGLGTDMDGNYRPVISDYREFGEWTDALAARGLRAANLAKLAGGNARRVLDAVL